MIKFGRLGTVWGLLGSVAAAACGGGGDSSSNAGGSAAESGGSSHGGSPTSAGESGSAGKGGNSGTGAAAGSASGGAAGKVSGGSGRDAGGATTGGAGGASSAAGGAGGAGRGTAGSSAGLAGGSAAGSGGTGGTSGGGSAGVAGSGTAHGGSAGASGGTTGGVGAGGSGTANGGTANGGVGGSSGGATGGGGTGGSGGGASDWPADCATSTWCELATTAVSGAVSAVDPANDSVWVVAPFTGTLQVAAATLTSAAGGSWVLAHYDSFGTLLGVFQTANIADITATPARPTALSIDARGNLYLYADGLSSDVSFTTSTTPTSLSFVGDSDGADSLVVKLDSQAKYLWGFDFASTVAVESTQGKLDTNGTRLAIVLQPSLPSLNLTQIGAGTHGAGALPISDSLDVTVLALDAASGAFEWAKDFGDDTDEQTAKCVAVDTTGDVIIGGQFGTDLNFDPTHAASALTAPDFTLDLFVAKLAGATAAQSFSKSFAGSASSNDSFYGCSFNPQRSDLYLFGDFDGASLAFGGPAIINPSAGDVSNFVAHLNDAGQFVYSLGLPSGGFKAAGDASGGFSVSGVPVGGANLGGGALTGTVAAKYSSTGAYQDSQALLSTASTSIPLAGPGGASFVSVQSGAQAQLWRYRP